VPENEEPEHAGVRAQTRLRTRTHAQTHTRGHSADTEHVEKQTRRRTDRETNGHPQSCTPCPAHTHVNGGASGHRLARGEVSLTAVASDHTTEEKAVDFEITGFWRRLR